MKLQFTRQGESNLFQYILQMQESEKFTKIMTILKQHQQLMTLIKLIDTLANKYSNFASEQFLKSHDKTHLVQQIELLNIRELNDLIKSIKIPTTIIALTLSKGHNYSLFFALVPNNLKFDWHSHPQMFGVSKCLYGYLQITTLNKQVLQEYKPRKYTYAQNQLKVQRLKIENQQTTALILPNTDNIHKIQALKTSAFLDLLMPDYPQDRCDFYQLQGQKKQNLWFKSIDQPKQMIKSWQSYVEQMIRSEKQQQKINNKNESER